MADSFWEKNAESWTKAIRSQAVESRKVTSPAILQEIIRRKPQSVLDLGCGEGWLASELQSHGIRYTGLDGSLTLIQRARESQSQASLSRASSPQPGTGQAEFHQVSYRDLLQEKWKPDDDFDLAVFNFALLEEEISPLLQKTSELLGPDGMILIQTLHPCFALNPYEDGWRREDFKSFAIPFQGEMPWYGRTLASWMRAISESGLSVVDLIEPLDSSTGTPASMILALGRL